MRLAILVTVLAFMIGFALLLVSSIVRSRSFGPLEALSVLILALFAFGGLGALRRPPDE